MKGQSEVIDLKIDAENGAMPAGETHDEPTEASAEVTPTPRPRVSLPERPGSRPEMAAEPAPSPDHGDDSKILIVGQEIVFNGRISSLDRLIVEGQVEFERADIAGIFEGELTVREYLVVRETRRITGKVRFGELERGGQIIGDLQVFVEGAQANGKGTAAGRKKAPTAKGTGKSAK